MTSSRTHAPFADTIAAVGLAALLSAAAACAGAQTIAQLRQKGELTVGLVVEFAPYGTTGAGDLPDGYDADVARLLARDLGLKLKLVSLSGPDRIPFLLTRKVDLLIASLAVTPERAKQVAFSRPYSAASILLYGSTDAVIRNTDDLRKVRVAAVRGTREDFALTSSAPASTDIRRFDDEAAAMQALLSGDVQAIVCSPNLAGRIARRAPSNAFEHKFLLRRQQMAVAVRPGQDELLRTVDDFVARATANGELNQLYRKWLDADLPAMK